MIIKLKLEEFFNWDSQFYNPSVICSDEEPEILSPSIKSKRRTAFVYFRMNLCQKNKHTIVFFVCLFFVF